MNDLAVSGNTKGFGMIEVKDIIETEDGGAILQIEIDMEDLKRLAKIGIIAVLLDGLKEVSDD